MGISWRIEYEGELYHIMPQGTNGQRISLDGAHRNRYIPFILFSFVSLFHFF